jgi:hypothetical protein
MTIRERVAHVESRKLIRDVQPESPAAHRTGGIGGSLDAPCCKLVYMRDRRHVEVRQVLSADDSGLLIETHLLGPSNRKTPETWAVRSVLAA